MNNTQKLRDKFLHRLYELCGGYIHSKINWKEFIKDLGISDEEANNIYLYLHDKGLVKFMTFGHLTITALGIDKVERVMAQTYAEKERFVLETIYEMGKDLPGNEVLYDDLEKTVKLPRHELNTIITELYDNKKYLMPSSDETLKVSPRGMEFLQGRSNNFNQGSSPVHNITHINAPVGNLQQFTNNSSQTFTQNNITNPEFDEAIRSILELVKSSNFSNFKKEDLISDIERIKLLAETDPTPELVEHAKNKINYLDTAIKGTDLALKVGQYLPALYAYFEGLLK